MLWFPPAMITSACSGVCWANGHSILGPQPLGPPRTRVARGACVPWAAKTPADASCSRTGRQRAGSAGCAPPLGSYKEGWAPASGSQSGARARTSAPCAPTCLGVQHAKVAIFYA